MAEEKSPARISLRHFAIESLRNEVSMSQNKKEKKSNLKKILIVSLFIILATAGGVLAWFTVSNRARVENLSMIADHSGNLQIADDTGNGPGTYSDVLDLATAKNDVDISKVVLSPVTTKDGVNFCSPNYDSSSKTVSSVTEIKDEAQLKKYYVYEKKFYLKAGQQNKSERVANIKRSYDIALYGSTNKSEGCYITQSASGNGETAANAIRISFTLDDGTTYVYEPNSDVHNSDTSRAANAVGREYGSFQRLYQQRGNGTFVVSPKTNESEKMFTMAENVDVRVTMRIWIEGTDDDCTNSIASDMVAGQIQFVSTEIKE